MPAFERIDPPATVAVRPIIFSAPMVRALLLGRKTQTRRLARSPLARARSGDRLWVREAVRFTPSCDEHGPTVYGPVFYEADQRWFMGQAYPKGRLRPAIHMPRWASRLVLTVTETRRQRLRDMTDADAEAEGVLWESADPPFFYVPGVMPHSLTAVETSRGAAACFAKLWDTLHRGDGAWNANPEVVALTFAVEKARG